MPEAVGRELETERPRILAVDACVIALAVALVDTKRVLEPLYALRDRTHQEPNLSEREEGPVARACGQALELACILLRGAHVAFQQGVHVETAQRRKELRLAFRARQRSRARAKQASTSAVP